MKTYIIVGRFQVPRLTEGHKSLFKHAFRDQNVDKVVVFIGETKDGKPTPHDPLPFEARKSMIEEFKEENSAGSERIVEILKIKDLGNYPKWVEQLDKKIESLINLDIIQDNSEIIILGSRDSVATRYKENGGKYEVEVIPAAKNVCENSPYSGTMVRERIISNYTPTWTESLRRFLIYFIGKNFKED